MGEVNREDVIEILRSENPRASLGQVVMYADAWLAYREAARNIATHGVIVAHPRTGAPMANPYGPVQAAAQRRMAAVAGLPRTDALWARLSEPSDPPA